MKKLMTFLLTAGILSTYNADAQLIPPTASEFILPTAASNVIRIPKNVSAYSYEDVSFDMTGMGTLFQPQHLEVYAWEPDNLTAAGIRWVRRDAAWNVVDDGYILAPDERMNYEVGILQDDDGNTFVLAVWNGVNIFLNTGTFYQTFLWTPTGLTPTMIPADLVVGTVGPTTPVSGRASLDCYGLRKAVVTFYEAGPTGYINACVFSMGSTLTLSNTIYIAGSAGSGRQADVSLGNNGNIVRVAWVDAPSPITPPHDIHVQSVPFSTIATAADGAVIPFNPESSISGATSDLASQLHIDCPDNFGSDIWSLVYMRNPGNVVAHTKRTSGALVSTTLSVPGFAGYTNPVVSYGQNGNIIVYGWYSSDANTYIATQLQNNGTTFIAPTTPGAFFDIPLSVPFSSAIPANLTWIDFSTNSNNSRLSMGYMVTDGGTPAYYDLRSKNVSWLPSTMRGEGFLPLDGKEAVSVTAAPNPFTQKLSLSVQPYSGESVSIRMVDITGKVILEVQEQDLTSVNQRLDAISHNLPPGNYFINVDMEEGHNTLKIVKL